MSMASSQAISGVSFGDDDSKSTPWLVGAVIIAALIIAWALNRKKS